MHRESLRAVRLRSRRLTATGLPPMKMPRQTRCQQKFRDPPGLAHGPPLFPNVTVCGTTRPHSLIRQRQKHDILNLSPSTAYRPACILCVNYRSFFLGERPQQALSSPDERGCLRERLASWFFHPTSTSPSRSFKRILRRRTGCLW